MFCKYQIHVKYIACTNVDKYVDFAGIFDKIEQNPQEINMKSGLTTIIQLLS